MEKIRFILPTAILAVGLFIGGGAAQAMPLPGEEIIGDYTLTVSAMGKTYEFFYPEIDCIGGEIYLKNAEAVVEKIYSDTKIPETNASVKIYPNRKNPLEYLSEKDGEAVDRACLLADIKTALYARKPQIIAKTVILKPQNTAAQLKRETSLLAEFSTDYSSSAAERKHNVDLAVRTIGGRELLSGETFSFNSVVGERTKERGYKEAKIITGGKFQAGVGGGVCQVSTTLYNAALLSGLTVTERHSHSLPVSYVLPSFDAMVNSGGSDLAIRNDRAESVYIVSSSDGERITFRVYGKADGCSYKRVSKVTGYISPPAEEELENAELPFGETKIITHAKEGVVSEGYLEVYCGGARVKTINLSKDRYGAVRGVVEYGTKKEQTEPKTRIP